MFLILLYSLIICFVSASPDSILYANNFRYADFLNHPKLNIVGDSRVHVKEIVIAGPNRRETGAVWFSETFDLSKGFHTEFTLTIGQVDNKGGEGIAFVFQNEDGYALGKGGDGMGYEGLGEGAAFEFDGTRDIGHLLMSKSTDHGAHVAIRNALTPGSKLISDHSKDSPDMKVVPIPNLAEFVHPVDIRISYNGDTGILHSSFRVNKPGKAGEWITGTNFKIGSIFGDQYWVGFTAATGPSDAARFAITKWKFGTKTKQGCVKGFTGNDCLMSNEEAEKECSRRTSCLGCVHSVYNCVWCGGKKKPGPNSGAQCIAGTKESIEECAGWTIEEMGCSPQVPLIWLWISLGVLGIVFILGFLLVRILPKNQAYRAVSMLVALAIGCISGMMLSYIVAASMVEISSIPAFSFCFGIFFVYLGSLVFFEFRKMRAEDPTWTWDKVATIIICVWITLAGFLCVILDKKIVFWMPEVLKVFFYMLLAAALTFCIVFSCLDVSNELYEKLSRRSTSTPGLTEILDSEYRKEMFDEKTGSKSRVLTVAKSKARYALLIVMSIVSGLYFGLVFGLLRIEEEDTHRATLVLTQESVFTFPAGAFMGGLSGLILQFLSLPVISDSEVDRIIEEAKDDL